MDRSRDQDQSPTTLLRILNQGVGEEEKRTKIVLSGAGIVLIYTPDVSVLFHI
jgi:hypothetical protein